MSIVRFLHWKDVFGVFLLAGVIYRSCCVEVEEDIEEFAIYFCANAISVTEAEIRIVNLLCLIAANANICRVSDILNDGLIEFTPHSVWDEKAGEHRIDDCQVRVFIIKWSAINICSIHHVFDSKSPTAIIYWSFLIQERNEAIKGLVWEGIRLSSTYMHPIFSKVQETIKVLDKVRICLIYQACNELCLIIIFSLSHPANANYSINNGWVDIILLSNYPNRSIGSALLFLAAVDNTHLIIDRIPTDYIHVSYTLCINRSNRRIWILAIFANIWACATVGVEHKYTLVTCVD